MATTLDRRLERADWTAASRDLDAEGWALLPGILSTSECAGLVRDYDRAERYRKTVDMERHAFGRGEYRYFADPLPPLVERLRTDLYKRLAPIANHWATLLGKPADYPPDLEIFRDRCHLGGQRRPTPLVLRYESGDYNRLHQDVYGPIAFPLQALVLLSQPGRDFSGGEVVFVEQQPRRQSRPIVVTPERGDAVIFPNQWRPCPTSRGFMTAQVRHGASRITSGKRYVLGIIFHDAA